MQNKVLWIFIIMLAILSFLETMLCSANHVNVRKKNRLHRNIYFLICAAIVILYVFKYEFSGVDDNNYFFNWYVRSYSWKDIFIDSIIIGNDGGYKLIVKLCKIAGCSYWAQSAIVFIFTLMPIFYVVYKKSHYYIFSLFLYSCFYWNQSFYLHRIALALSLCFLGGMLVEDNKYFKAVIVIWAASTVHISAVVACGFFVIKKIPSRKLWQYAVAGVILGGFISYQVIPQLAAYYQAGRYLNQMEYNGGFKLLLLMVFISLLAKELIVKYVKKDINSFSYKVMCFSIPIQMFSMKISIFVRMVYIYFMHLVIAFPNILYEINKKSRLIISMGLIAGGILWLWFIGDNLNSIRWYFQKDLLY